jgi:DNA modification methylase
MPPKTKKRKTEKKKAQPVAAKKASKSKPTSAGPSVVKAATQTVTIAKAKGRPMLTWVGKRPLTQVVAFPAQHIETFDPDSDAVRRKEIMCKDWPKAYPHGGLLFHGDNKEVLAHLLANGFRGKVNLIYIDPPFDSGADYVRKVSLRGAPGTAKLEGEWYTLGEQIQYTDMWTNDNYLQFMYERLAMLKELLAENGTFYLHCDSTKGHQLRCLTDEVFGNDGFKNEIIWFYENKLGTGGETFDSRHDTLLVYTKAKQWTHHEILVPVKEVKLQPVTQKIDSKRVWLKDEQGKRLYQESHPERPLGDVWVIPIINPVASERSGFPTQKPEELLEYVVKASSNLGDLVLDCFIGSGTTIVEAQKLGRRWIGCDINKGAIQTTRKRLQTIIAEQITGREEASRQGELIPTGKIETPVPAHLSFAVYRVNDYDLQIQHNEAVNLACEHIGVTRTRTDAYFDGTLGKRLAKIVPFGHPLTLLDLEELKKELNARPDEERDAVLVCLGKETAVDGWLEDWNRIRRKGDVPNKIEVIELRTDPKYGKFFVHQPAKAKVTIRRDGDKVALEIEDFISPTIIERLKGQSGILSPQIDDWRAMVDCVMIDSTYDGSVFNITFSDVPEKKNDLVTGKYEFPAPDGRTTVAVKISDMLGEEVLITKEV